jgi:hypothetical protein
MPGSKTVLDGSLQEDTTKPLKGDEWIIGAFESRMETYRKYKMTEEEILETVRDIFKVKRVDGLYQYLYKKPDGKWAFFTKMEMTSDQKRFYDYVSTM